MSNENKNTQKGADAGVDSTDLLGKVSTPQPMGFLDEYFLECGEDGVVRVKDGRTLEEYINHPKIVERRKNSKASPCEMVICTKHTFEMGILAEYSCA